MEKIHAILFCAATLAGLAFGFSAQSQVTANRYLFIVETAKAMKPQMPAVRQCLRELLGAGLGGQIRAGDTLGFWTYDADLHTGAFPLQVWGPSNQNEIIKNVDDFLNQLRLRNEAQIAPVLPPMLQVVKNSDTITVLIFSDGLQPLQGTPFDLVINKIYGEHAAELRAAKIPFLTILQARGGKIVNCVINPANGPINIPKLAAVVALPMPRTAPVTSLPAPVVVKTNASLILDYSKTKPMPARNSSVNSAMPILVPTTGSPSAPALGVLPESNLALPKVTSDNPSPAIVPAMKTGDDSNMQATGSPVLSKSVPRESKKNVRRWWFVAVGFLILVLAGLFVRRSRSAARASMITESFEQRRK